jgi:hypothetical protein
MINQKEKDGTITSSVTDNLLELFTSEKFYISLIIPIMIGTLLSLIEVKVYLIFMSFLLGVSTLPLLITIKEIFFKNNDNANKDLA